MKTKRNIKASVKYFQEYMETYPVQIGYESYRQETYIDDILYGLGVSLDKKYMYVGGFDLFKKKLLKHLGKTNGT